MTVRDGAAYLAQALSSLRAQTFTEWELVVRDDGSTDDTLAIARSFADTDPRIRIIAGPNVGRRAALVEAHAHARGPTLAWLDADDWLAPDALSRSQWALTTSRCDLVYTDHIIVGTNGEQRGLGRRARVPYSSHRLLLDFMTFHFRLFTRDIFERAGGIAPDREIAIDYDLCLRISELGRIHHLAEPLYFYRQHAEQMSTRRRAEQIAASAAAIRAALVRRRLPYELGLDEARGRFHLVPHTPTRPRASRPRIALATLAPRLRRPAIAKPTSLGDWPASPPANERRMLYAASEARGVRANPLGADLARLVRTVWLGRAGEVVHIHDLAPLFAPPHDGGVLATMLLFAKTLDHARARGSRIVWTSSGPLTLHARHPRRFERAIRDLALRCDAIITHWPEDVARIALLGGPTPRFIAHPHLGDAFPMMTRDSARASLGLSSSDTTLYVGAPPSARDGDLVLDGDLESYAPRHVAAYVAAADIAVIASPTAHSLAVAMSMGLPIVAPSSPSVIEIVGSDGFFADIERARASRDTWTSIGSANAERARAVRWDSFVDAVVGAS